MRWCAVSVDLDEIPHYHRIHGLTPPADQSAHAIYDVALERCFEFANEHQIPLTFFVVGSDTERPANAARLRRAVELGHELGNHTRDHRYDLVRLSTEEQRAQVFGGAQLIERNVGVRPRGFRAPGYTVSDALLELVSEAGHVYDSSVFPCPPYYAAKATAFAALALRGRRSRAILDTPAVLRAPTRPYRIGRPYYRAGQGLLEFPIQVTRGPRLPYIGTGLVMAGLLGARALTRWVIGEPLVNLELHGIDWLGSGDGLEALRGYQPDVHIAAAAKRRILSEQVARLRDAGYLFTRLDSVAVGTYTDGGSEGRPRAS